MAVIAPQLLSSVTQEASFAVDGNWQLTQRQPLPVGQWVKKQKTAEHSAVTGTFVSYLSHPCPGIFAEERIYKYTIVPEVV